MPVVNVIILIGAVMVGTLAAVRGKWLIVLAMVLVGVAQVVFLL